MSPLAELVWAALIGRGASVARADLDAAQLTGHVAWARFREQADGDSHVRTRLPSLARPFGSAEERSTEPTSAATARA